MVTYRLIEATATGCRYEYSPEGDISDTGILSADRRSGMVRVERAAQRDLRYAASRRRFPYAGHAIDRLSAELQAGAIPTQGMACWY